MNEKTNLMIPDGVNPVPAYVQEFNPCDWNTDADLITSKDGRWTVSNWGPATGGNMMLKANFDIFEKYEGDDGFGYISLKTTAVGNLSALPENFQNNLNGAEVFSPQWSLPCTHEDAYGYGYFECRMKVAEIGDANENKGVCASFFLQSGRNDPGDLRGVSAFEIDFEFLTNGTIGDRPREPWVNSENPNEYGYVATVLHPGNTARYIKMAFNPSKDFHTYGILWLPNKVEWYIDGKLVRTEHGNFERQSIKAAMNNWTGSKHWGGYTPQNDDAVTYYDYFKYYTLKDESYER